MPQQTRTPGRRGAARHGRLRRRGPFRALVTLVASALAVLLVSGASLAAITAQQLTSSVTSVALDNETAAPKEISAIPGGANILLIGSDQRDPGSAVDAGVVDGVRNDVNILVHLSEDQTQLTAVSFPRDLMIDRPACTGDDGAAHPAATYQQFNTLYGDGGISCTVAAVESMTGLSVYYAGMITFDGVIEMSNALGGVDVCVTQRIRDTDTGLDLSAGTHSLQGKDALEFLRTRHGVGDGSDLARISSQQVFLSSMMRTIISGGTLGSPTTLYKLASAALGNMTLSSSLSSPDTLVSLALALRNLTPADIVFVQYPVVDDPDQAGRVIPAESDAAVLEAALQADQKFTLGDEAVGRGSTVDESAAPAPAPETPAPAATGTTGADDAGTTAPAEPAPVTTTLPSTITGQTAAEATCSVGSSRG
ncbi:LytR family transcriptional attenuator [Frigoribacterium sp. PhB107]|uniref:LCP family protein n=1 Tax=Frigoribacterium sp. PhB107 TaxID=2485172 RepID=UPI000F49C873|nr:LCP family protein [Frigoribacterium sp. PhB107]ROP75443.1 LytR family transcriptional attenuator [Frigoribacterium sp. PhB107]